MRFCVAWTLSRRARHGYTSRPMANAALVRSARSGAADRREPLDAAAVRAYLRRANRIITRHATALTRLDAVLGDGDHGDNLVAGLAAIDERLGAESAQALDDDLPALLTSVGATLVASVGGASGPLYGAAFMEAGFAARSLDGADKTGALALLLQAAAAGLARRGHCAVGDKTIYDTLAPAADALRSAADRGLDGPEALREMVIAGARGMRSTTPLVARRGLALRLGERSRGHRDPGAASCLLLLLAIASTSRGTGAR